MRDGSDKPIYYASRSLSSAEKGYSQLDKEGLAIIFAVKKFHNFLYGRHFVINSDHRPLQHIFGHDKPVPTLASARLQRWALLLGAYDYRVEYKSSSELQHAAYDYRVEYKSSSELQHADGLSRLPLPESPIHVPLPGETVLLLENMDLASLNFKKIRQTTNSDPILSRVRHFVLQGWGSFVDNSLVPYHTKRDELSIQDGCILRGSRVVIPAKCRGLVMDMLHEGHPGICRMKSIARGFVWWPGIDEELEGRVRACKRCQFSRHSPTKVPLHPWEWPQRPWGRIHIDHAGGFLGKLFLLAVDAHSKWMEVEMVDSATSDSTIRKLRTMFSTHGLPEVLVSDNGSAFSSEEFQKFMGRNNIRHVRTAPYHPS